MLYLKPPQKGDVYVCDAFDIMAGSLTEKVLHDLMTKSGENLYTYWDGTENYRLTINNVSMPYYICKAEVLVKYDPGSFRESKFIWKERSQVRRIDKKEFLAMILDGRLKKYDSNQ